MPHNDFDIKNQKKHGDDVVFDRDPAERRAISGHATFEGRLLDECLFSLAQEIGGSNGKTGKDYSNGEIKKDGKIIYQHHAPLVKSFFIRATNYKIAYFLSSSHFCGYIYLESVHKLTVSKKVVIPAKAGIQGSR